MKLYNNKRQILAFYTQISTSFCISEIRFTREAVVFQFNCLTRRLKYLRVEINNFL